MRLVCPGCGGTYSLEGWENDVAVRQFNAVMASLPHQVQQHAARYLGLFRKGERGLAWKRALRILQELKDLVASGSVQWDGGETRPAPPQLWAEVMLEMLDRGLKELDDHNYLRKVVWSKARELASKAEADQAIKKRIRADEPEPFTPREPKRRNCYTCAAFRPPKGCSSGNKPVAGNLMAGCGANWTEKAAAIGDLAVEITGAMQQRQEDIPPFSKGGPGGISPEEE